MNKEIKDIENNIKKKIEKHEKLLLEINDENKKIFIKGCITGLRNAILSIPLITEE